MPNKKINQLDAAGPIIGTDLFAINQNQATGKAVKAQASDLANYFAGVLGTGAQVYFDIIAPPALFGNDGDVYFDTNTRTIYKKEAGTWNSKTTWISSAVDFVGVIRVMGGGSAFTTISVPSLLNYLVTDVLVENMPFMIRDPNPAAPLLGDEFEWDFTTAVLTFGSTQNAGVRIKITYVIP